MGTPSVAQPALDGSSGLLEVSHVGKSFGRRAALSGVSFSVGVGEVVGLVGPNGAGKSTAFRIVCGLLRPDTGTVTLAADPFAAMGYRDTPFGGGTSQSRRSAW